MASKIITVSRADVEERFRKIAAATHGKKKGYLGRALTEAMEEWAREKEERGSVATALRMVMLLTPNSSQSWLSEGSRSPCFHTFCTMRERRTSAVWW